MLGASRTITALFVCVVTQRLDAQEAGPAPLAVRGAVVSEGGERVPYAVVGLAPGFPQQFATADGRFAFTNLGPGVYRLVVRQVGYRPFDSTITVQAFPLSLRVVLRRIAIALPAIEFGADVPCTRPGVPDRAADPALADLFEQLRENASRSRMLVVSYPHRYYIERRVFAEYRNGTSLSRSRDTLVIASADRWTYRPGRVVEWGTGRLSRTQLVHLPELSDLADSLFHRHHCFILGGVDTIGGAPLVRLDFKAEASLSTPDINGSAWLDRERFQLRRLRVELTHPERADRGVSGMTATATFREEFPYVMVVEGLVAMTMWRRPRSNVVGLSEQQMLLRVEFERLPGEERP